MMYGYYAMALLGYKCPWKARLTQMQLGQFCIVLVHSLYCFYKETVPRFLCGLELFVMANMLVPFSQFYLKSYSKKVSKSSPADVASIPIEKQAMRSDSRKHSVNAVPKRP